VGDGNGEGSSVGGSGAKVGVSAGAAVSGTDVPAHARRIPAMKKSNIAKASLFAFITASCILSLFSQINQYTFFFPSEQWIKNQAPKRDLIELVLSSF
jgi:hypothetical protein